MSDPGASPEGAGASTTIIEDLFVTDAFLVKGRLANKFQRLAKMLEDNDRAYFTVEDATLVSLRGNEVIHVPRVLINQTEIVFAHELVDVAGDSAQRKLAARDKPVRIRGFYSGAVQIELAGNVEPGAYEPRNGRRNYFVMEDLAVRGVAFDQNPELAVLRRLNYAIVRKGKLAYIYDFSRGG